MKKNVLIVAVIFLFSAFAATALANEMTAEEKDLCDAVWKKFPENVRSMLAVEINSYKPAKEVYLYVRLDELALGTEAEAIGTIAVQGALEWLMSKGHNPAQEWIAVNARPYAKEKGATGQELRRVWGKANYDWNTDQIVWQPAK